MIVGRYHKNMFKHTPNLNTFQLIRFTFRVSLHDNHPVSLEELKCLGTEAEHSWRRGPLALEKLTIRKKDIKLKELHFPEGLVKLNLCNFDFKKVEGESIRFPSSLKSLLL